jgi:hypothetical protein
MKWKISIYFINCVCFLFKKKTITSQYCLSKVWSIYHMYLVGNSQYCFY